MTQSVRMCVGCRKKQTKSSLERYTLVDNELSLDTDQNHQARGYYVCNKGCLTKATLIVKKTAKKSK